MAVQSGLLFLLKTPTDETIASQAGQPLANQFFTFGGIQSNSAELTATEIDITSKTSGENKKILDQHGIVSVSFSGDGVLEDDPVSKNIQTNVLNQKLRWFQVTNEAGRSYTALFKIVSFNITGSHDGAVQFSISLVSSGTIYVEDSTGQKYDTGTDRITAFNNLAGTLNITKSKSADYTQATFPADKLTAFNATFATNVGAGTLPQLSTNSTTPVTLEGSATAGSYAFPFFAIAEADIGTRQLQVLDALNQPVDPQPLADVTIGGATYKAYYLDIPLGQNATYDVYLQAG